jgi:hypothetical protein
LGRFCTWQNFQVNSLAETSAISVRIQLHFNNSRHISLRNINHADLYVFVYYSKRLQTETRVANSLFTRGLTQYKLYVTIKIFQNM